MPEFSYKSFMLSLSLFLFAIPTRSSIFSSIGLIDGNDVEFAKSIDSAKKFK